MEIRLATEQDIPEIVNLLRKGLGSGITPKSEHYWRWKHFANPFGKSMVLLAICDDKIIGVRSFMRWQWKSWQNTIEAVRGVDTVVDAAHQRNGIFGELTMELMTRCRDQGYHFLFSTPNEKSKRGYLKLGWDKPGNLPLNVRIVRPFSILANKLKRRLVEDKDHLIDSSIHYFLNKPDIGELLVRNGRHYKDGIITAHSVASLRWRYIDVPAGRYYAVGIEADGTKALCFYRIKKTSLGNEMRITDIFIESSKYENALKAELRSHIKKHEIDYLVSGSFGITNPVEGLFSFEKLAVGPSVTLHEISLLNLSRFVGFESWNPTLGDLELF